MDKFDVMAVNKIQAEEITRLRELVESQKATLEALCIGTDGSTPAIVQLGRQDVRIEELEARQVPEGWVALPIEPTEEMLKALLKGTRLHSYGRKGMTINEYSYDREGWEAMLAVARRSNK